MTSTIEFLYSTFKEENIEVETSIQVDEFLVLGNRSQLQQVLLNIFKNAVDAMENSKIKKLSIQISAADDNLSFTLVDTGHGVNEDIKSQILDPFFTTKDVGKGSGLGLSISQSIVSKMAVKLQFEQQKTQVQKLRLSYLNTRKFRTLL